MPDTSAMKFNKIAFRAGKDDFLDSWGYVSFQPYDYPNPNDLDWLDSYAMGVEHTAAMSELTAARAKAQFAWGQENPDRLENWHPLWGGR